MSESLTNNYESVAMLGVTPSHDAMPWIANTAMAIKLWIVLTISLVLWTYEVNAVSASSTES